MERHEWGRRETKNPTNATRVRKKMGKGGQSPLREKGRKKVYIPLIGKDIISGLRGGEVGTRGMDHKKRQILQMKKTSLLIRRKTVGKKEILAIQEKWCGQRKQSGRPPLRRLLQ